MPKTYEQLEAENKSLRAEFERIKIKDSKDKLYSLQLFRVMTCRDGRRAEGFESIEGRQPLTLRHVAMDEETNVEGVPWFVPVFVPSGLFLE